MKKIILAAVAVTLAVPTAPVVAKDLPALFGVAFNSHGACQSAFMQVRNCYRQNPDVRHANDRDLSSSEYNEADRMGLQLAVASRLHWRLLP